ncbi:MAG: metallophosphoesterase [Eubacterium sp.]|nr:metallophosphoesterase [Eubacterium sp.]
MKKYNDTQYKLSIQKPGIPSGSLTICFFSDLHNCCRPEEAASIRSILQKNNPDLILCGGDSIVGKPGSPVEPAAAFLTSLAEDWAAKHPEHNPSGNMNSTGNIYMGMGNHEYRTKIYPEVYGDMYPHFLAALQKSGHIILLQNETADVLVRNLPVRIYGFSMDRRYYGRFHHEILPFRAIADAFHAKASDSQQGPAPDRLDILLAHDPTGMDACLEWGADLTLCGHYHGGIVRFGKHSGLISPDFHIFTGKAYGLFQRNGKSVIVSSGCGEHTIPIRIHNPREIVTIHIQVNCPAG